MRTFTHYFRIKLTIRVQFVSRPTEDDNLYLTSNLRLIGDEPISDEPRSYLPNPTPIISSILDTTHREFAQTRKSM